MVRFTDFFIIFVLFFLFLECSLRFYFWIAPNAITGRGDSSVERFKEYLEELLNIQNKSVGSLTALHVIHNLYIINLYIN